MGGRPAAHVVSRLAKREGPAVSVIDALRALSGTEAWLNLRERTSRPSTRGDMRRSHVLVSDRDKSFIFSLVSPERVRSASHRRPLFAAGRFTPSSLVFHGLAKRKGLRRRPAEPG
jgi:hypothetical protein